MWQPEKCNSFASTRDIKNHIQRYLNGQNPESPEEGIIFMSMFNDIKWTKNGIADTCLLNAKEVSARTLVLLGACVRKYVVEPKFQ